MKTADIMTHNPLTTCADHTLRAAIELMAANEFHHLPVLSTHGHLIGVITARDCRLALRLPDILPEYWPDQNLGDQVTVGSVMSTAPITVEPDTPIVEVARLLLAHYVSCLPVMLDETLVGIVTISDVLIAFVKMYPSSTISQRLNP